MDLGDSDPQSMSVSAMLNSKSPSPRTQTSARSTRPPSKSFAKPPKPAAATAKVQDSANDWANTFEIRFNDEEMGWIIDHGKIRVTATIPVQAPIVLSTDYGTVDPAKFASSASSTSLIAASIPIQKQQMKSLKEDSPMTSKPDTGFKTAVSVAAPFKRRSPQQKMESSNTTWRKVENRLRRPLPNGPLARTQTKLAAGQKRSLAVAQQYPKSGTASGSSKQSFAPTPSMRDREGTASLEAIPETTAEHLENEPENDNSTPERPKPKKRKASKSAESRWDNPTKGSRSSIRTPDLHKKPTAGTAFQEISSQDTRLETLLRSAGIR